MRAILLAAGVGSRFQSHSDATPPCLVEVGGKTLLRRHLDALATLGIFDAVVVVGYRKEQVAAEAGRGPAEVRVRIVENARYMRGNILSLWQACHESDDDVLIVDGDILFPQEMLARLLATPDMNAIAVDEQRRDSGDRQRVVCEDGWVVEVTRRVGQDARVRGEAVGMLRLSADAAEILRGILDEFVETEKDSFGYEDAFRELAVEVPIGVVEVGDLPWIEVDHPESLALARDTVLPQVERLDRGEPVPTP